MTTISIVTPSYNQGEYLENTIRSVISQKGEFYIDYVIMDGGSTDNSVDIIRKYDEQLKNGIWECRCLGITLRWVSEKDRGQTHAINKGFQIAYGEIVSYINSDDMFFDDAFSKVAKHFHNNPQVDLLFGDGDVINENGEIQWEWLSRPYDLKLLKSYHFLWNDFTNYIMQQATFWRRSVFDRIGLMDETFHYGMDIEYWLRVGEAGLKAVHIPIKLGKFRMITGTKSLSSPTVFWPDSLELFRRYNGASNMAPFFKYYFYNEGLNTKFDIDLMKQRGESMFNRWDSLSKKELLILQEKALKGFNGACLMLAHEAYIQGDTKKANEIFRVAVSQKIWHIIHYNSIYYFICRVIGKNWSGVIRKVSQKIIHLYRMKRYLYRYLEKK